MVKGVRYGEARTYSDNRVLIDVPAAFDATKPLRILVFFHGHLSELRRQVIQDYGVVRQIARSGRNVVLVAPQLALNAVDSHPGKISRRLGLRHLLEDVSALLSERLRVPRERFDAAPVFLSAFSGGYRAVADSLERGGIDERIAGLILLDAVFGDAGRFAAWMQRNDQRVFLVAIYSAYSARQTDALRANLRNRDIIVVDRLPREIGEDDNIFVKVSSPHLRIPADGPPPEPIAEVLRRLPRFETYIRPR